MTNFLLYCLMYLIEGIISYYYFGHAFHPIAKKSTLCACLFVTYLFQVWIFSFNIILLNLFFFTLLNFLFILFFYSATTISALIHSAILTACMGLSEIITSNLFGGLLTQYANAAEMTLYMSLSFIFLSKTLYFLCLYFILFFIIKRSSKKVEVNKGSILIIITTLLSFAIFSCLAYVSFKNDLTEFSQYAMIAIANLLLILNCLIICIYEYHQVQSEKIVQLELDKQRITDAKQYSSLMEHQAEQLKILRHDIKNHLSTIRSLYDIGSYNQANEYVNELIHTDALTHFFQPTGCETLNLILARYCTLCQEHRIRFQVNAQSSDLNYMQLEDITSLFCNLLDNAYEAANKCSEPFIDLVISSSKDDRKTIIALVNSCDTAPIPTRKKTFSSSKTNPENHGIGQKSIRRVVNAYHGKIDSYFSESEKAFHTILFICTQAERISI